MRLRFDLRPLLLVAFVLGATGAPTLVRANGDPSRLPQRRAPAGFHTIEGDAGGRIVEGAFARAHSERDALRAVLRGASDYFDGAPDLAGIVRATDGSATFAVFRSRLRGANVTGLAIAVAPHGIARGAFLFDRTERIRTSLPGLVNRLLAPPTRVAGGADARATAVGPLHRVSAPDGTISAGLPDGWAPKLLGNGALVADGPDGAEVAQMVNFTFVDPRGSLAGSAGYVGLAYSPDPGRALENLGHLLAARSGHRLEMHVDRKTALGERNGTTATALVGHETFDGNPKRFDSAVLITPPMQSGVWSMQVNSLTAPSDAFARDLPAMKAIVANTDYNGQAHHDQIVHGIAETAQSMAAGRAGLAATTARDQGLVDASMANARASQDAIDRQTSGFVRYLGGTDVLESRADGSRGTTDADFAARLAGENPSAYRVVPVSEYRKGVDY